MKVSVIVFPGSNCDHDAEHLFSHLVPRSEVKLVWHRESDLGAPDLVVLPGGFSYGDYLRTGALARISPAMREVASFAEKGGRVLGICNGFQILCESGLLPGVLLRNIGMKFLSRFVHLRVEENRSFFNGAGQVIRCPIAHGEGNYFASPDTIKRLEDNRQIVFRYCDKDGQVNPADRETNPNGSLLAIAGITNEKGNVVGLMPHPERSSEKLIGGLGGDSCFQLFSSM